MICVKRRRYAVTACFCVSACLLGRCDYACFVISGQGQWWFDTLEYTSAELDNYYWRFKTIIKF